MVGKRSMESTLRGQGVDPDTSPLAASPTDSTAIAPRSPPSPHTHTKAIPKKRPEGAKADLAMRSGQIPPRLRIPSPAGSPSSTATPVGAASLRDPSSVGGTPTSPLQPVVRLATETPRLSPRPSPATTTLVAPVWAGSGRGTAPRDGNSNWLDESHFEPVATLVARLASSQSRLHPVPRPGPPKLSGSASEPRLIGQKSFSGPPSICDELVRSAAGSPYPDGMSCSDSELGSARDPGTPSLVPPGPSPRPKSADGAVPRGGEAVRDPLRGTAAGEQELSKPASMSDERWERQQGLYQKVGACAAPCCV